MAWNSALTRLLALIRAAALPTFLSVVFFLKALTLLCSQSPSCSCCTSSHLTVHQISRGFSVFLHDIKKNKKKCFYTRFKWCVSRLASSVSLVKLPAHPRRHTYVDTTGSHERQIKAALQRHIYPRSSFQTQRQHALRRRFNEEGNTINYSRITWNIIKIWETKTVPALW